MSRPSPVICFDIHFITIQCVFRIKQSQCIVFSPNANQGSVTIIHCFVFRRYIAKYSFWIRVQGLLILGIFKIFISLILIFFSFFYLSLIIIFIIWWNWSYLSSLFFLIILLVLIRFFANNSLNFFCCFLSKYFIEDFNSLIFREINILFLLFQFFCRLLVILILWWIWKWNLWWFWRGFIINIVWFMFIWLTGVFRNFST